MESRGWKPACPPRVPDEDLTTPYVDSWEESQGIDSCGPTRSQNEEQRRSILPAVAPAEAGESNAIVGPYCGDMPAEAVPTQLESNTNCAPHPAKVSQAWDLHWSYTKWAVETMRFARNLAPWQKVNHFRNSNELCRKVGASAGKWAGSSLPQQPQAKTRNQMRVVSCDAIFLVKWRTATENWRYSQTDA